jgi:hypothetical protein
LPLRGSFGCGHVWTRLSFRFNPGLNHWGRISHLVYFIYVEAAIDALGLIYGQVEKIAIAAAVIVEWHWWLDSRGWKLQVFVQIASVSTGFMRGFQFRHEFRIEVEELLVCLDEGDDWDLFLH